MWGLLGRPPVKGLLGKEPCVGAGGLKSVGSARMTTSAFGWVGAGGPHPGRWWLVPGERLGAGSGAGQTAEFKLQPQPTG